MTKLDWVSNALRTKDAELRGGQEVVPWKLLQESEKERWREMGRVAIREVQ